MLADSARDYLQRGYGDAVRSASLAHPHGGAPQRWQEFAELGWLALPVPERDGGLAGSLPDFCRVAQERGRALAIAPYLAWALLGATLLADVAPQAVRAEWLPNLADRSESVAFAPREAGVDMDWRRTNAEAQIHNQGWHLTGQKAAIPGRGRCKRLSGLRASCRRRRNCRVPAGRQRHRIAGRSVDVVRRTTRSTSAYATCTGRQLVAARRGRCRIAATGAGHTGGHRRPLRRDRGLDAAGVRDHPEVPQRHASSLAARLLPAGLCSSA